MLRQLLRWLRLPASGPRAPDERWFRRTARLRWQLLRARQALAAAEVGIAMDTVLTSPWGAGGYASEGLPSGYWPRPAGDAGHDAQHPAEPVLRFRHRGGCCQLRREISGQTEYSELMVVPVLVTEHLARIERGNRGVFKLAKSLRIRERLVLKQSALYEDWRAVWQHLLAFKFRFSPVGTQHQTCS